MHPRFKSASFFFLLVTFGQLSAAVDGNINLPNAYEDGPTKDKSPGLGIEFESSNIRLKSETADQKVTFASKGKLLGKRKGTNWKLTADTTGSMADTIAAEYILDGTEIKIGAGTAAVAAEAVAKDVVSELFSPSI